MLPSRWEKGSWQREGKGWRVEGGRAGSGFAAALVDVVLHKGNDLLELVVQLSAPRSGVGLQSVHHLTEGGGKGNITKDRLSAAVEHSCIEDIES